MSELVVYSIPGSPFGRAVLIALEEKAVPYHLVPVPPNTLRTPEHLSRHPFGRVPVLEHGDFRLCETQAILRYLDRVLPQPALSPADPRAVARMDQLMNVSDWYVFQGVGNVIGFQRIVAPRVMGRMADEAAIAAALPRARQVFEALAALLGGDPYFAGAHFTLADVLLAPQLDFLGQTPEWQTLSAPHANLRRWLERIRERPSLAATTWEKVAAMGRPASPAAARPPAAIGASAP
jgi:glutathione S-transferase